MNVLRSDSVFPSYCGIKKSIIDKKDKEYQRSINTLTKKLAELSKSNNFQADHYTIKKGIIALASQHGNQKAEVQKQDLRWASPRSILEGNNQQSLNYYIEDDKEQQNNYQTYLKFKKKALQRDLEQDKYEHLTGKEKKKQQEQEQHLFKHLYHHTPTIQHTHKRKNTQFSYSNLKNHAYNFKRKIDRISTAKPHSRTNKPAYLLKQKQRILEELNNRDNRQKMLYQNNKKILTQNYSEILKKLESTNIVKWRILRQQGGQ